MQRHNTCFGRVTNQTILYSSTVILTPILYFRIVIPKLLFFLSIQQEISTTSNTFMIEEISTTRKQSNSDVLSSPTHQQQSITSPSKPNNTKKVLIEEIAFEDDVD